MYPLFIGRYGHNTTIWNSYLELSTEYYRNTIVAATCVHKAVKRMHQKKHPLVSSEAHN
jgi:hypothetical protein